MRKRLNAAIRIAAALLMAACLTTGAGAQGVYKTYTYDYWGEYRSSPDGYEVELVLNGEELGAGDLLNPEDMYIDAGGSIYIADTGNGRVVICDPEYRFVKSISRVVHEGDTTELKKPTGVFVTVDGKLLIADSELKLVFRCDMDGNVDSLYRKPTSGFEFTGIDFIPLKVAADDSGYVYVLCKDLFQGAMMYEGDGDFVSYYGANATKMTLEIFMDVAWRRFMTAEQRSRSTKVVPVGISNFDIDGKNFIYTCTSALVELDVGTEQIRKLNSKGVNVLNRSTSIDRKYRGIYGDLTARYRSGKIHANAIADVVCDEEGFISCVDENKGRIFQYDGDSNLLFAFGNTGDQKGVFRRPTAIETYGGKLFVLDAGKNNFVVFRKTRYCEYVREAIKLHGQGLYAQAESYWEEVLKLNHNFGLAYLGLGKIRMEEENYREAMKYFKIGEDRENYGKAFKQYRNEFLRAYILPAALIGIALAVAAVIALRIRKKLKKRGMKA